jgi:hypothetical protein
MTDTNSDEIQVIEDELLNKPKRITKSTGKIDKRSIISKENAKHAGKIKLQKLKQEKEQPPLRLIEGDLSDDDSSSDDNVLIFKQKSKKRATKRSAIPVQTASEYASKRDIDELKQMAQLLAKKKPKTKIIKVAAPAPVPYQQPVNDSMATFMKQRLLNF